MQYLNSSPGGSKQGAVPLTIFIVGPGGATAGFSQVWEVGVMYNFFMYLF